MRKFRLFALAAAVALTLCACGGNADNTADTAAETTTAAVTEKEKIDMTGLSGDELRAALIETSFVSRGNTARLEKKLSAAKNGEEITIVYLGGSITEGLNAGAEKCYAKLSADWLSGYTGGKINYVNSGMSGTPSILGNIRAQRDVIDKGADIVFIEFAVNDGYEDDYRKSYESLVRTILKQENNPAVILLFNVIESGHTCREWQSKIGEHYSLPMISPADSLTAAFEAGAMKWSDYSNDGSHPHEWGHALIADMIANYFEKAEIGGDPEIEINPVPLFGNDYEDMIFMDSKNLPVKSMGSFKAGGTLPQFPDGFVYQKGTGNEPLTFDISASRVFIVYREAKSADWGTAEILSDGEHYTTVNANTEGGWNNPTQSLIFKNMIVKDREVGIKMAEGSEDKNFEILGIAYSTVE